MSKKQFIIKFSVDLNNGMINYFSRDLEFLSCKIIHQDEYNQDFFYQLYTKIYIDGNIEDQLNKNSNVCQYIDITDQQ